MTGPIPVVPSVFPFRPLLTIVRGPEGRVLERTVTMELSSDAAEALDRVLEPFALSWAMLGAQLNESFPALEAWPWAVVAFQKEFRLMGHACSLRKSPLDYSLSSYSMSNGPGLPQGGIPPVSLALIRRKEVLADLGERSLLFKAAWDLLEGAGAKGRWLVLPINPPEAWVESVSEGDDGLFRQVLEGAFPEG